MKKIQGIIFDMDGVLFDTERVSKDAWEIVGKKWGYDIGEEFLSPLRGGNIEQTKAAFLEKFGEKFDFDTIWQEKRDICLESYREHGVPVKKGVRELLQYLRLEGKKIAVATGSSRHQTMWNIKNAGIEEYFDTLTCGDEVKNSKPNPEIFQITAKKLSLLPKECLVIEDSLNGVQAALQGGFHVVMVPDLTMPTDEIVQKVDSVLEDLIKVIQFLKE